MAIALVIFIFSMIILGAVGLTGVYHVKKYRLQNDLTDLAVSLYLFLFISIIVFTLLLVFMNGFNAPVHFKLINMSK